MATPPAYRIVTDRLVLRPWNPEDAPALRDAIARGIEHLGPWLPWARAVPSLDEELETCRKMRGWFDLGQDLIYGAFLREDECVVVGGTGLHPRVGPGAREIGYWIDAAHVRKGFATELAAAMTRVGFEVEKLVRIEIHHERENRASEGVPKKLGFTQEAVLPRRLAKADGSLGDRVIHALWYEDYALSPASEVRVDAFDGAGRPFTMEPVP